MGVVEWFRPGEFERVEQALEQIKALGLRELRTGVSWSDYHRLEGPCWYDWLLPRLSREVNVVPCFVYTPPSIGLAPKISAPPKDPKAFADFLDMMITRHDRDFEWIELWNEPNDLNNWDWRLDPDWMQFSTMVGGAAYWIKQRGKKTVLAGLCPTDPNWLALMCHRGVMQYIDAVGIHVYPGTREFQWSGWNDLLDKVRLVLRVHGHNPEIWITEAGYSTWRHDEINQVEVFLGGLEAPVDRFYWCSLQDLDPALPSMEGFHVDERHYHFGMVKADGTPKLLYRLLAKGGLEAVQTIHQTAKVPLLIRSAEKPVVITGGAGFIGSNLADRLARMGRRVVIYDNLSRPGVEDNLLWLRENHGDSIAVEIADVLDPYTLRYVVRQADQIFHFAAQVAVTTSLSDPADDFDANARGTLNLLEAIRAMRRPPPLVFTSTNKVYGKLGGLELVENGRRYLPADERIRLRGIDESQALDFYSPYGCSKGAADQYVVDYARIYNLPAVVFRMSCIYGPRQLGTEDQGWVAHFLINALAGEPITLFGDGKQVRDVLFVEDLLEALLLAQARMPAVHGQAFNIGGGPGNTVSLLEILDLIGTLNRQPVEYFFGPWRPGDQAYYVSNIERFRRATGWRPKMGVLEGVSRLHRWLREYRFPATVESPLELAAV